MNPVCVWIVLLEANLQGIPVIASDIASIRESVNCWFQTEILCDPHSRTFTAAMSLPSWQSNFG